MTDAGGDPRQNLLQAAQAQGTSLARLSELIGRNASYLHQYVTRGTPRRLGENDRAVLAEFLGVRETELGGGRGGNFVDADWADIPRLALGASAGPGSTLADEMPLDSYRFSRRWLRQQGLDASALSAISVEGDSMEPLLRDGDEILVDRATRPFRDGVHVVRVGEALLVKRVAAMGFDRYVLMSENKAYPPLEMTGHDIDIIGRVVWKAGRV